MLVFSLYSRTKWAWNRIREIGPLYAGQRALWLFFPRRWFEINQWILMDTDLTRWRSGQTADGEFRWATTEDFGLLAEFGDSAKVRKAFDRGHRIVVAVRDGKICGWIWFATGPLDYHDWLRLTLEKDECFFVDVLVDTAFRGQGIGPRMAHFAYGGLEREGYRKLWGFVDALNRASLNAYKESIPGTGRLFYARMLGLTYLRIGEFRRLGTWGPKRRWELRPSFIVSQCKQRSDRGIAK